MDFDYSQEAITPDSQPYIKINSTGALWLPVGTTLQRPTGSAGMFRYNSDSSGSVEYFNGSTWVTVGSGGSGPTGPTGPGGGGGGSSTASLTNAQGSTINIGQAVYTSAAGSVALAKANASTTKDCIGIVSDTTIANGVAGNITLGGVLTATTGQWDAVAGTSGGLVAGAWYYLSTTTAGSLTSTAPNTPGGGWVVPLGIALSTTQLGLNLNQTVML